MFFTNMIVHHRVSNRKDFSMKRRIFLVFLLLVLLCIPAAAHSGGTDENGGHYDHSTGEYHYHHGHSAHQHPGGICPYINSGSSSGGNSYQSTGGSTGSSSAGSSSAGSSYSSKSPTSAAKTKSHAPGFGDVLHAILFTVPVALFTFLPMSAYIGKSAGGSVTIFSVLTALLLIAIFYLYGEYRVAEYPAFCIVVSALAVLCIAASYYAMRPFAEKTEVTLPVAIYKNKERGNVIMEERNTEQEYERGKSGVMTAKTVKGNLKLIAMAAGGLIVCFLLMLLVGESKAVYKMIVGAAAFCGLSIILSVCKIISITAKSKIKFVGDLEQKKDQREAQKIEDAKRREVEKAWRKLHELVELQGKLKKYRDSGIMSEAEMNSTAEKLATDIPEAEAELERVKERFGVAFSESVISSIEASMQSTSEQEA